MTAPACKHEQDPTSDEMETPAAQDEILYDFTDRYASHGETATLPRGLVKYGSSMPASFLACIEMAQDIARSQYPDAEIYQATMSRGRPIESVNAWISRAFQCMDIEVCFLARKPQLQIVIRTQGPYTWSKPVVNSVADDSVYCGAFNLNQLELDPSEIRVPPGHIIDKIVLGRTFLANGKDHAFHEPHYMLWGGNVTGVCVNASMGSYFSISRPLGEIDIAGIAIVLEKKDIENARHMEVLKNPDYAFLGRMAELAATSALQRASSVNQATEAETDEEESEDSEDEDDFDQYELEDVLDHRWNESDKTWEYLIKWVGYDADWNTWEPTEHFIDPQECIGWYWDKIGGEPNPDGPKDAPCVKTVAAASVTEKASFGEQSALEDRVSLMEAQIQQMREKVESLPETVLGLSPGQNSNNGGSHDQPTAVLERDGSSAPGSPVCTPQDSAYEAKAEAQDDRAPKNSQASESLSTPGPEKTWQEWAKKYWGDDASPVSPVSRSADPISFDMESDVGGDDTVSEDLTSLRAPSEISGVLEHDHGINDGDNTRTPSNDRPYSPTQPRAQLPEAFDLFYLPSPNQPKYRDGSGRGRGMDDLQRPAPTTHRWEHTHFRDQPAGSGPTVKDAETYSYRTPHLSPLSNARQTYGPQKPSYFETNLPLRPSQSVTQQNVGRENRFSYPTSKVASPLRPSENSATEWSEESIKSWGINPRVLETNKQVPVQVDTGLHRRHTTALAPTNSSARTLHEHQETLPSSTSRAATLEAIALEAYNRQRRLKPLRPAPAIPATPMFNGNHGAYHPLASHPVSFSDMIHPSQGNPQGARAFHNFPSAALQPGPRPVVPANNRVSRDDDEYATGVGPSKQGGLPFDPVRESAWTERRRGLDPEFVSEVDRRWEEDIIRTMYEW